MFPRVSQPTELHNQKTRFGIDIWIQFRLIVAIGQVFCMLEVLELTVWSGGPFKNTLETSREARAIIEKVTGLKGPEGRKRLSSLA